MDKKSIGNLISYERNKKNFSLPELSDGVCSVSALYRLERGERLPDFFVLERIFERLGKSVNKIEFLYDEVAYEIYYLREVIEKFLEEKNYQEAEGALVYYASKSEAKEPLHKQYIYKMQAVIMSERDQNHKGAEELLEEALEETLPGFSLTNLEKSILGEGELLLLLLWIQEKMDIELVPLESVGTQILSYIERVCQDEEAKANVYSKATWVLGTVAMKHGNTKEALWYTLQGEQILADNGLLMHLLQFLDRILELTKDQEITAYRDWEKQRDALEQLYEEYGEGGKSASIKLWENYRQREVYLVSEVFKQERIMLNQSQEKLAEALEIDIKTISRIEGGKYKPQKGTFQKIKEYYQIDRDICTTRIVVDEFYLLELEREIAKLNHYRQEEEAEKLYKQLKKKLSIKWKENQQYIKYMDTLFDYQLKRITVEEAIQPCIEALQITRENSGIEQVEGIVPSRMEASILNYIAMCYDKTGRKEKAIDLLKKIVAAYECSKVELKYHYVSLALVYQHLAFNYEECDRLEEANIWCDKAIQFELRCQRGLNLGSNLIEKNYIFDRITGDRSSSKNKYLQAYQLLKLMKKETQMKSLQKIYKEWYEENVDS